MDSEAGFYCFPGFPQVCLSFVQGAWGFPNETRLPGIAGWSVSTCAVYLQVNLFPVLTVVLSGYNLFKEHTSGFFVPLRSWRENQENSPICQHCNVIRSNESTRIWEVYLLFFDVMWVQKFSKYVAMEGNTL